MASFVQGKLKSLKPSAKNVSEKYREVLNQTLKEFSGKPKALKEALEVYLVAGEREREREREKRKAVMCRDAGVFVHFRICVIFPHNDKKKTTEQDTEMLATHTKVM